MKKYNSVMIFFLLFFIISIGPADAEPLVEEKEAQVNILKIKEGLQNLGFYHDSIGSADEDEQNLQSAIKEFQEYHGLLNTGSLDIDTEQKIKSELQESYFYGDMHEELIEIQQALITLGYGEWTPSIEFESSTEEAVLAFQKNHPDLRVTGVLDSKTQIKIELEIEKIENIAEVEGSTKQSEQQEESVESKEQNETVEVSESSKEEEEELVKSQKTTEQGEIAKFVSDSEPQAILEKGVRSDAVKELQKNLIRLGFGDWKPTTYFGTTTENALKDFQTYHGLSVNGMLDKATENRLNSELQNTYFYGDRNSEIQDIQSRLIMLGYGNWTPTVRFGPTTEKAVLAFQESYSDLKVTGVLDSKTQAKLKTETKMLKKGIRSDAVKELQENLIRLGFGDWKPTTYFGTTTENALKDFQTYHGLSVNGMLDKVTENRLNSELQNTYFYGDRNSKIQDIQSRLIMLGYGNWTPTVRFGPTTEKAVLAFQRHYSDLKVTGVLDTKTQTRLILETEESLQKGMRSDAIKELQENLMRLGFGKWNSTTYFGSTTEGAVKDFQTHYGLNVNGIYDSRTKEKLEKILNSPYQYGNRSNNIRVLQEQLINLGFGNWNPTTFYGSKTENAVRSFQKQYSLPVSGIADEITLSKIVKALEGVYYSNYDISLEQALELQMKVSPQTDNNYGYVSKAYINNKKEVTADVLNVRAGAGTAFTVIGKINKGNKVTILEEVNGWYRIQFNSSAWVNASKEDVLYYLDPTNFLDDDQQRFQFLDLSRTSGATKTLLNNYLKGKGILEGRGDTFITASRLHGVNDIYLLSHALLETGNGFSQLANGIEVGLNATGKPVLVTSSNRKSLTQIRTTYNMFGIGAVDSNPLEKGAIRAYNEGWFSPDEAIIGGAKFIGNSYIKAGQNTLYKMRWNPVAMAANKQASHQYATDIGWASKQTNRIYSLYREIGIANLYLDIPNYR